jgi:hypothetical protein
VLVCREGVPGTVGTYRLSAEGRDGGGEGGGIRSDQFSREVEQNSQFLSFKSPVHCPSLRGGNFLLRRTEIYETHPGIASSRGSVIAPWTSPN